MVSDEVRSALKTLGLSHEDRRVSDEELERLVNEKVEAALAAKTAEGKAKKADTPKKD